MQALMKHGSRCLGRILNECRQLVTRNISLRQFREECARHYQSALQDINRPPLTDRRKAAIRSLNDGIRLYNGKRFSEALRAFEESVEYDPQYGRAHLYYGNAQYKLRNYEEALASWQCVIRIEPNSDIAEKAREKLERIQSKEKQTVREMTEHLRQA
ncbi:MAG: tetratricopeptide repeat protein [Candidatus Hydrogenedentes bacterium]|nr:tetratricopeptide repeat protein [Candidatus Hydrogenedentota bacterium]